MKVKRIKIVFAISKNKKLDDIIQLLENESLVSDIHLVSRPHTRLKQVDE